MSLLDLQTWTGKRLILTVLVLNVFLLALGFAEGDISEYFGEDRLGTNLSGILLILLGITNFRIYRFRRAHLIWLLMGLGFLFLAYDDLYKFHEGLDKDIHRTLDMTETSLTDRLDDFIIGIYGLIGIGALFIFRAEIARYRILLPYLFAGFAVFGLSVVLDIATNDSAILRWAGIPADILPTLKNGLATFEEVCKLMAEAIFLAGFFHVLRKVRTEETVTQPRAKARLAT